MRQTLFASVLMAGMIYGSPGGASLSDKPLATPGSSAQVETILPGANTAIENMVNDAVQIAAVDYCYAGSIIDPATGESFDLFVLCAEDGMEQNLDLA